MNTEQPQPGTAVAVPPQKKIKPALRADGGGVMAILPRNLPEAVRYADGLAASGIVPDSYKVGRGDNAEVNVPLVVMGVLKSMEIGLPPQTGLAFLLPINGRFSVWGDGMWALAQRGGQVEDHLVTWFWPDENGQIVEGGSLEWPKKDQSGLAEWPNTIACEVKIWRKGQKRPWVGRFSVGDARRADLWNNPRKAPWRLYPERMLFNRARAFPLRDGFADALFGLGVAEEAMDAAEPRRLAAQRVDTSSLDDDLPPPARLTDQAQTADDLRQRAESYRAGLSMCGSLEALEEYQTQPGHVDLMHALRQADQQAFDELVADNARRYQEIEQAERRAANAADDARITAEDAQAEELDPDRLREDRDERRGLFDDGGQP